MNFLPAQVLGSSLRLPFVDVPIDPDLAAKVQGHGIVVVGLRPEHIADAYLDDDIDGVKFTATVDVIEWLGNEQYAYVPFDADPGVRARLDQLERELDGEGMRTQMVVNLDSRSRIREGEEITFVFETDHMLVFDPETGDCLTRDEEAARRIAAEAEEDRRRALERGRRLEAADIDLTKSGARSQPGQAKSASAQATHGAAAQTQRAQTPSSGRSDASRERTTRSDGQ